MISILLSIFISQHAVAGDMQRFSETFKSRRSLIEELMKKFPVEKFMKNKVEDQKKLAKLIDDNFKPQQMDCEDHRLTKLELDGDLFKFNFKDNELFRMNSEIAIKLNKISTNCTTEFKEDMAISKDPEGSRCRDVFNETTKKRPFKPGDIKKKGGSPSPFSKAEYLAAQGVPYLYAALCCEMNFCEGELKTLMKGRTEGDNGIQGGRAM